MTRPAMTLIETLLALALCSALAGTAAAWVSLAATTGVELSARVRWETAARATLSLIGDDLISQDDRQNSAKNPLITVDEDRLTIHTRGVRPQSGIRDPVLVYEFDAQSGEIHRHQQGSRTESITPLIGNVAEFNVELDDWLLTIMTTSEQGWFSTRTYLIEEEPAP